MPDPQRQLIGKALGRIPSGVFILTARHGADRGAMLASWVQQAAFDPPCVSIAIAKSRPIGELIRQSQRLAISVIPDADRTLMKRYARPVKEGGDPFVGVATMQTPAGVPVLRDALAWLEGRVIQSSDFGADHELLIAEVSDAALLRNGEPFVHLRGSGFHY